MDSSLDTLDDRKQLEDLAESVEQFLIEDGKVGIDTYKYFYSSLRQPPRPAAYICVLILRMLLIEIGQKETSLCEFLKGIIDGNIDLYEKESILSSIYFVALYYPFNSKYKYLQTSVRVWKELRVGPKTVDIVDEVLRMLGHGYIDRGDGVISLVEQCSNTDFPIDFTIETATIELVAPCLINTYLRNCLLHDKQTDVILNKVLLFLQYPLLIVENRLLPLLHMLRSFIATAPRLDTAFISRTIEVVQQYYLWPRPYGDVAKDLLQMLKIELKSPGAALRAKFIEENPELQTDYPPYGKERTVHILLDRATTHGELLQGIITAEEPEIMSLQQLHITLLHNTLVRVIGAEETSTFLHTCDSHSIAAFYHQAINILNEAVLMGEEDAIKFREEKLKALLNEIRSTSLTDNGEGAGEGSPKQYINTSASPPPLQLDFLPISCDTSELPSSFETKYKYPHKTSAEILVHVLKQYSGTGVKTHTPTVKIAIAGNDQTLHNIVGSYIYLKLSKPELFYGIHVRFYFIPVDACHFADFLARNDGWYGRHVLCITDCILRVYPTLDTRPVDHSRSRTIVWREEKATGIADSIKELERAGEFPERKEDTGSMERSQAHATHAFSTFSPSVLLRTELQNYFREANHALLLNIYQCECWGPDGSYFTLPFFNRCELGIMAATRAYQASNRLLDLSLHEIQTQVKEFKSTYSPPYLNIKFTQMNVCGVSRQGTATVARSYNQLTVANVHQVSDRSTPADPSKSWLEVFAIEGQKKKRGREYVYHVSMIELEPPSDKKKAFSILLDGVLYTPLVKIKITPCTNSHDEIQNLPIYTYFPFST